MAKSRQSFLLLALSLFLSPVFATDWTPSVIGPFGTLNNRDNAIAIASDKAQDLLNVDLTPGGKSVRIRDGYGSAFALSITTSPVHGTYAFFDANSNDVALVFNDTRMSASVSGSSPSVLFSTGSNGATYQCTDSLGFAYCANSARTNIIKTNGVTYSFINNVTSTGTMLATAVTRLAMAGFSDRPSDIDFSADADFTTWGSGSLGSSAVQLRINAPGAKVTHITYAFGRLIWFKDTSFGYVLIGNQPLQADWVIKTISYDVGTNDNSSVYREGILYFRGKDSHFYAFDGNTYKRVSSEIAGTVGLSQAKTSGAWTQTSAADFGASSTTPSMYLDTTTISGSIFLASATPVSNFIDSVSTDYAAGFSFTNVDTTTIPGSVSLKFGSEQLRQQMYGTDDIGINTCSGGSSYINSVFLTTSSYVLTSVIARLKYDTALPSNEPTIKVKIDSSGAPGTTILTSTFSSASITNSYSDITIIVPNVGLTANTSYWVEFQSGSDCSNTPGSIKRILWSDDVIFSTGAYYDTSRTNGSTLNFKTLGKEYPATGKFTSRAFDTGFSTGTWLWSWSNFYASGTIISGTNITYETQTSSSATGIFSNLVSVSSGSMPTSTVQQFIRYVSSFTTTNQSTSPILNDVQIYMSARRRPNGNFYSQVKNAPNLTAWDSLGVTKVDNDGTQTFYIRSSTNPIGIGSSTPSWTSINAGAIPSISTGTYFQIRDDFLVTYATQNPTLQDFTQNWFEGSASDKAYATYFDDKIWWSVTYGTGASTNNRILLYDLLNNGWLQYDLAINGFYTRNNNLYFGSSASGNVYKYGTATSDNGSAINSYWRSKDYVGDSPFTTDDIVNLSLIAKSVQSSSMTATYVINGSSYTSCTVNLYAPNSTIKVYNKNTPLGLNGYSYSLQIGNNAVDQPWEVFGAQFGVRPNSWTVSP